ncbi:MAG TPA: NAD(P)H-dependent oxidoreductase [Armatimonadota bacterium]
MISVLGISGSPQWPSHTRTMLDVAFDAVRHSGARVELLDIRDWNLPPYSPQPRKVTPQIHELRERFADASAYLLATPAYHGGMSGMLKTLLDYVADDIGGKLFGLLITTERDDAGSTAAQLRDILSASLAWALPYDAVGAPDDFAAPGLLTAQRLRERLQRLGRDVAVYGDLLAARFARDRVLGGGVQLGFAPWFAHE